MRAQLFDYLSGDSYQRAEGLPLFADPERLARKPRCSDEKGHSVIRTAPNAVTRRYIQPNSPVGINRLVCDLDWHNPAHALHRVPVRHLFDNYLWEHDMGVPSPNWGAVSPDKNGAHVGWELETPVGRHEHARAAPQRYLAALESAYTVAVQADPGYSGSLCKNPLNTAWDFYRGRADGFSLRELADWVDLTPARVRQLALEPRGEAGRNVYVFDGTRGWAYGNVEAHRSLGLDGWTAAVVSHAQSLNGAGFAHLPGLKQGLLPLNEAAAIGRSVAKWTWTHFGKRELTAAFSDLQRVRGAKAAAVKRGNREEAILAAIGQLTAQGQIATMVKVAKLIGCSKSGLSMHYGHLFQGTAH